MPIDKLNHSPELDTKGAIILVVDDQPINIQAVYNILNPDYVVAAATSGADALEFCQETIPDLILLDVLMPDMSGLEVCQQLKQDDLTRDIPIIFVTSISKQEDEDDCWLAGAVDFISKPVNPTTLKNRIKAHLTIKYQRDMLMKLVFIDGLTGLYNRRYFDEHLQKLQNAGAREGGDTAILLMDVDCFKLYNDHYGHLKGDEVLRIVASVIIESLLRPADFACRYGGEEMVVVLPDTDCTGALQVAERIRRCLFDKKIEHIKSPHNFISISIGVTSFCSAAEKKRDVVQLADEHLYEAKKLGRNTVFPAVEIIKPAARASVKTEKMGNL
jgi:diguanylate cyclase (GGDEF)-like protein